MKLGLGLGFGKGGNAARFNWYVDSVNGNDANTGTLRSQPLKTLSALLGKGITTGARIGLARGSFWREQLSITGDISSITVAAYGVGKLPVLSASDIAVNGSFVKSDGYTNLYEISWAHEMTNPDKSKLSVWEDGARLLRVADIAAADTTPGSFYAPAIGESPQTVYVHAKDSTNIIENACEYEISRRKYGLTVPSKSVVKNIHTKNNGHNDGSLIAGNDCFIQGCLCEGGTVHNLFISSGAVYDTVAWKGEGYVGPGSSQMFVGYTGDSAGKALKFVRCTAIGSYSPLTYGTGGFYAHDRVLNKYTSIEYIDCKMYNLNNGFGGICETLIVEGGETHAVNYVVNGGNADYLTVSGLSVNGQKSSDGVGMRRIVSGANACTVTNLRAACSINSGALLYDVGADGVDAIVESCTFAFVGTLGWPRVPVLPSAGSNLIFDKNIVYNAGKVFDVGATVASVVSNNNVIYPASTDVTYLGTAYTSVVDYQTATGQDANSLTSDPALQNPANGNFTVTDEDAINLGAGAYGHALTWFDFTEFENGLADM